MCELAASVFNTPRALAMDNVRPLESLERNAEQFERELREARAEVERLKKENDKLRNDNAELKQRVIHLEKTVKQLEAENESRKEEIEGLQGQVTGLRNELSREVVERKAVEEGLRRDMESLTSKVEAMECDHILLEISELLCNLEVKVVDQISQDPKNTSLLSQLTDDEVAIDKWQRYSGLPREDLNAFSTMLHSVARERNKVAHPQPKKENRERWMTELRKLRSLQKVKTDTISKIINLALQALDV